MDTPEILAPVHIYSRVGAKFHERAVFIPPAINSEVYSKFIHEYRGWLLARVEWSSGERQAVPGFGGFISATSAKPSRKSTLDYFSTIKKLLRQSEDFTMEVDQEYVLNTFDLGGSYLESPR